MIVKLTLLTIIESTNTRTAYFFQKESKTILPIELNQLIDEPSTTELLNTPLYMQKELLDLAGIVVTTDLIERSLEFLEDSKDI